ncbi:MAG: M20/M25/M40 family metallo-hydrolase [Pseudonocardiaceae bacterium]
MIEDIVRLVRCESPSDDLAAVARSGEVVAAVGARILGAAPERLVIDGRTHLRWRFGDHRRVLLLGHHDTVWPKGTLAAIPCELRDGILRGPGCFDMKTRLVMAMHAVAGLSDRSGVTLLVTGDEELGSPTSRTLIESEAAGCAAALVLEGAAAGGALKTERKGVSLYDVELVGRASHAGLEPERGVSASVEASHQLLAVAALGDAAVGTTVTPTRLEAGTTANTVPAWGRFAVDVRARTATEQARVHTRLTTLAPVLAGAGVKVSGGVNRPPLESDASAALFASASRLAARLGLSPLSAAAVGGASDGNLTAGVGTPTLDGLGAVGGGAHAEDEHVIVSEIPGRTALVRALVEQALVGHDRG